jgi:hypothetical protein
MNGKRFTFTNYPGSRSFLSIPLAWGRTIEQAINEDMACILGHELSNAVKYCKM